MARGVEQPAIETATHSSLLFDLDDNPIYLYVDPLDDNIVYGVTGFDDTTGTGDIVFAVYLEDTHDTVTGFIDGAKIVFQVNLAAFCIGRRKHAATA